MLELGASIGTAAEAGRRRGLDAFALELDAAAVTEGRRLFPEVKFTRGRIEDMPGEARFEILYAAEVIEHLRDPAAFLRHCRRLLVPGGVLFLTTPDLGHPRRPEPLLAWGSVRPPEHVHLFTKSGMISLLEAQGFPAARALPHAKPGMRVIARRPKDNPAV
jgi:2-polyprenyl-3-methyl-5-hydroxy-6-metoxy-1,4-benzoquinol methylase